MSGDVDEYGWARPSAGLRPFVAFYTGYRQRGLAPALHRGLPSPYLTLIFTMDEPLEVARHPDTRQRPGSYDALIGGLHLAPAVITHPGRQSGVQVALRPLGCRALFGLPAAELAALDVDAAAVLGDNLVDEVRGRVREIGDWRGRFAAVDAALGRVVRPERLDVVAPEVRYACRRLLAGAPPLAAIAAPAAGVAASIAGVAAEVGWSGRHLTDRFLAEVGLRPKEAARVARFDRARREVRPGVRLTDIAIKHGFSDQSHFIREFRAFAGCTPTRWLADEFGFVQATAGRPRDDRHHD